MSEVSVDTGGMSRSNATRNKLKRAVIEDIAELGITRLTHRSVAKRAGVSLASTTYHYKSKADLIVDASRYLAAEHLGNLKSASFRKDSAEGCVSSFRELCIATIAAAFSEKFRAATIAWLEIIVLAAMNDEIRSIAVDWFQQAEIIWSDIAQTYTDDISVEEVRSILDSITGQLILARLIGMSPDQISQVLSGQLKPMQVDVFCQESSAGGLIERDAVGSKKAIDTRARILEAAIAIIQEEGVSGVTHRSVAKKAGLASTAPIYYYKTIENLIQAVQVLIFNRAKDRYREAAVGIDYSELDIGQLSDLTGAVFLREVTEYKMENFAEFTVFLDSRKILLFSCWCGRCAKINILLGIN